MEYNLKQPKIYILAISITILVLLTFNLEYIQIDNVITIPFFGDIEMTISNALLGDTNILINGQSNELLSSLVLSRLGLEDTSSLFTNGILFFCLIMLAMVGLTYSIIKNQIKSFLFMLSIITILLLLTLFTSFTDLKSLVSNTISNSVHFTSEDNSIKYSDFLGIGVYANLITYF